MSRTLIKNDNFPLELTDDEKAVGFALVAEEVDHLNYPSPGGVTSQTPFAILDLGGGYRIVKFVGGYMLEAFGVDPAWVDNPNLSANPKWESVWQGGCPTYDETMERFEKRDFDIVIEMSPQSPPPPSPLTDIEIMELGVA